SAVITGSALNVIGTNLFNSELSAVRDVYTGGTNSAPQAGQRHFLFQRLPEDGGAVVATAIATINSLGRVVTSGSLSDGRRFACSSLLSTEGESPFYVSFYSGTEIIIGWIQFGGGQNGGVAGTPSGVKSATNGFSIDLAVVPGP